MARPAKPTPGPSASRTKQYEATSRAEIVAAAARAFMSRGYAGSSIDMIAKELGTTKGPIYYRYTSKADLFFEVQKEAMHMNLELIGPLATGTGSPGERLQQMIEQQILLIMTHLPFQRVLVQGVEMHLDSSTTPAQRKMLDLLISKRDEYEQLFVRVIAEGVENGDFATVDPGIFAKVMLGSITWLTMWYRPQADDASARQKLAHEMTGYVLDGLHKRC